MLRLNQKNKTAKSQSFKRERFEIISKTISYNQTESFLASGDSFKNRDRTKSRTYLETSQAEKFQPENSVLYRSSGIVGKMTLGPMANKVFENT